MRPYSRQRGIALLLVLIAVAMATVLALSFISAQQTSRGVAQNVTNQTGARHIAESALAIAIEHVRLSPDWRAAHGNGLWLADQPFAGGTYSIYGEDGQDLDGDGVVDGDGDLADDDTEKVTITVIATYEGTTHRVAAVFTPAPPQNSAPAFIGAALGGTIELTNTAEIKTFDSSGEAVSAKAWIATNAGDAGAVYLTNSAAIDANVAVGADPADVIDGAERISGDTEALTDPMPMPAPPPAPNVGPNQGDAVYSGGSYTIDNDMLVNKLEIAGNTTVSISGHRTIHVRKDFVMKNLSRLEIAPGSSLRIYIDGKIELENNADLNVNTGQPALVTLFGLSSGYEHTIKNSARVYAVMDAPTSAVKLSNGGKLYGAVLAESLRLANSAALHVDVNAAVKEANPRLLTSGVTQSNPGGGGGGGGGTVVWQERP